MKINKELIRGSLILTICFGIYNLFNFLFQFSMVRMLSVSDFGILSSLYSVIYIFGGLSESIQNISTRYSSNQKDDGFLKNFIRRALKKSFLWSILTFVLYLFISIVISYLTKIDYLLVSLIGLVIFSSFILPLNRGLMQGRKYFFSLGANMVVESSLKLILSISLVILGWKVYGAVIGTIVAIFISLAISFLPLNKIFSNKEKNINSREVYETSKQISFITLTLLIFYSIDVFLARIFFTSEIAGTYSIISILSKIIFFGTVPISKVMFPMVNEGDDKKSRNIFLNSLFLISILAIFSLLIFYLFPEEIINIFSGKKLFYTGNILFILGIGMSITAITNLVLINKISKNITKNYLLLPIFIILEVFLMASFSYSLITFSLAFALSSLIFLIGSIIVLRR